jgi:phosphatidylglycerophosphatase C
LSSCGKIVSPNTRVVLFDFDGVLFRGDALAQFLRERVRANWWRHCLALLIAPIALPLARTPWSVPFVMRVFERIARLGADPEEHAAQARAFAQRVVGDHAHRLIGQGIDAVRRAVAEGARVLVVSGNLEIIVRGILDAQGLHQVEVLGARISPYRTCIGAGKLAALSEAEVSPPWDVAYTDSLLDLPMLHSARRPVLINANEKCVTRATRALGREVESLHWR